MDFPPQRPTNEARPRRLPHSDLAPAAREVSDLQPSLARLPSRPDTAQPENGHALTSLQNGSEL